MLLHVFVRTVSLLKSIVDDSVVVYHKIIYLADSKSTNMTNTMSKNVTSPVPRNSGYK